MTRLQDEIIEIYNTLQEFSKETLEGTVKKPIMVSYDLENQSLKFSQGSKTRYLQILNYYCGKLKTLKDTYLLPEDYDYLMRTLQGLIKNNILVNDYVCISPEVWGFDVLLATPQPVIFKDGPIVMGEVRFASGNSWIFKLITKYKYKDIL